MQDLFFKSVEINFYLRDADVEETLGDIHYDVLGDIPEEMILVFANTESETTRFMVRLTPPYPTFSMESWREMIDYVIGLLQDEYPDGFDYFVNFNGRP